MKNTSTRRRNIPLTDNSCDSAVVFLDISPRWDWISKQTTQELKQVIALLFGCSDSHISYILLCNREPCTSLEAKSPWMFLDVWWHLEHSYEIYGMGLLILHSEIGLSKFRLLVVHFVSLIFACMLIFDWTLKKFVLWVCSNSIRCIQKSRKKAKGLCGVFFFFLHLRFLLAGAT